MIHKYIILEHGPSTWQLYDLKRDPFEARNLFKKSQHELLNLLSGDLLNAYVSSGNDLAAATTEIFVKYVELEMAKEYRGPTYPHKLWTTMFRSLEKNNKFLEKVGFIQPGTNIFAKDYCEDLTLLRDRMDNFRMASNVTAYQRSTNSYIDKIEYYHINKYF